MNVGRRCRIQRAIIDRDVHIPEGTTIGYDAEADRQRYFVTEKRHHCGDAGLLAVRESGDGGLLYLRNEVTGHGSQVTGMLPGVGPWVSGLR